MKHSRDELLNRIDKLGINVVSIKGNEACCLCPKHDDSSPSFFFNLDTEAFHCFVGCLKGRGLHQLIYQITGISEAGVSAGEPAVRKLFEENRKKDKVIIPSIPMLPMAILNRGEEYLNNRGINRDSIVKWEIRFWDERNAVVIPIEDKGYALRFLKIPESGPDKGKKYKYITGTKIGDTVFGISKLPKKLTNIILVEGSLDCIYLHQIGYENALALLHADITLKQIKLIGGVADCIYIMLDGDKAGREASHKIKTLLNHRFIKKVCNLPEGKDPDQLTKEEIESVLKNAK